MTPHTMTFRGNSFRVVEGSTHPAYSLQCFTEAGEEHAFREQHWHPQPGDVVVDVGASYGAYALTAAACGAHVMAFEPEPSVFVDLERNRQLNPDLSIDCICAALWSKPATIDMREFAKHWPQQTITGTYPATSLDSFALNRLDWAKIDVEGCEVEVLTGALETLKRCKPVVIVEVHTFINAELLPRCRALLESAGYAKFEELQREPCVLLIARPGAK